MAERYYTPPQLAKLWGIKPGSVLGFIRSGELRAFDISSKPGVGRPRWKISLDSIIEFQNRRSLQKQSKPIRRRKRKTDDIFYF